MYVAVFLGLIIPYTQGVMAHVNIFCLVSHVCVNRCQLYDKCIVFYKVCFNTKQVLLLLHGN